MQTNLLIIVEMLGFLSATCFSIGIIKYLLRVLLNQDIGNETIATATVGILSLIVNFRFAVTLYAAVFLCHNVFATTRGVVLTNIMSAAAAAICGLCLWILYRRNAPNQMMKTVLLSQFYGIGTVLLNSLFYTLLENTL